MKKESLILLFVFLIINTVQAQVTAPVIKANFGVDADLRANYFDGFLQGGNDDWFRNNSGPGNFIIDTTGASYLLNQYTANPGMRMYPLFRGMRYPQLSVVNNRLLIDAIFIRDHHGDDSTVFAAGSNKNSQHPGAWVTPVSQGIPDKNDILDMFMHARRDGPNLTDSLWLFGGLSLDAITGNRYFDFEMYQTDITYNRSSLSFSGFGPDAGHTSWLFDATGKVLRAGDVIFTAEYSSSALTMLEARIWVHQSALSTTPTAFIWGGQFDGASTGSSYGYANILPKTAGNFYTGTQCGNNTWAGPFAVVLQNNAIATTYTARQFMEFSVNLSKLGLDYLSMNGDACSMPFRRILVKSRSSTSFNAELKDFVGPFDFFRAPRASASASIPVFCGSTGYSRISVNNPLPTSLYTWTTENGTIVGNNIGPSIDVNTPGSYVVTQELMDSCGTSYAKDTVMVYQDVNCMVLKANITQFKGEVAGNISKLTWVASNNQGTKYYDIEKRLPDGSFIIIGRVTSKANTSQTVLYTYSDQLTPEDGSTVYYRLKMTDINGNVDYSKLVAVNLSNTKAGIRIITGLYGSATELVLSSPENITAKASIYNISGSLIRAFDISIIKGSTVVSLNKNAVTRPGVYVVKVIIGQQLFAEKMVVMQ